MSGFAKDWTKEKKPSITTTIADTMNPTPLQARITKTIQRLNMVQRKLEDSHIRTEQKYNNLFKKCIRAQDARNTPTAIMYANECSQMRKIMPMIVSSQHAIEQVTLRLETVQDFGDIASVVIPASSVIRTVKDRLKGVIPAVSANLNEIGTTLDTLVTEIGGTVNQSYFTNISGEEAEKVLAEASTIAEQKVREGFPELPTLSQKGVNP